MHTIGSHLEFIFVRTNLHSYYGFSNPCSCSVYFEKFLNQRTTYFWILSQIISGWFLAEGEINSWRFHRNSEWFSDPGQNTGFIVHPWTSFHGRLWQKENNISWGNMSAFPQSWMLISMLLFCCIALITDDAMTMQSQQDSTNWPRSLINIHHHQFLLKTYQPEQPPKKYKYI